MQGNKRKISLKSKKQRLSVQILLIIIAPQKLLR